MDQVIEAILNLLLALYYISEEESYLSVFFG